ncbi:MAG: fluoride efflux transporter CrcB [Candidatus Bathyarchaeota archaeon]|nr:fluoride efflux transporter CrcB [Candidatus Bathyarchaeota archaeon]
MTININTLILIGLGGMVGAILRYLISGWAGSSQSGFPLGTLAVNFTGTLALGTIMYLSEYTAGVSPETRTLLTIGVLGAYTTMSTFGYESFRLLEQGDSMRFASYLLATNGLVILGVLIGKIVAQRLAGIVA